MSDQEFETYLKLLGKLLRLSNSQRNEIADEFRTHFDQRVEDLVDQGKDSEGAVRIALRDFGDASALAQELTRISRQRKRRLIMKTGIGSAAVCAAIVFLAPQLIPVAAIQQDDGADVQEQLVAADSSNATDAPDDATNVQDERETPVARVAGEEQDPWKAAFNDDVELEVIDLARRMPLSSEDVSRRRAAEIAQTVRQVIPGGANVGAASADGLLVVVADAWVRDITKDLAERMIVAWNERDAVRRENEKLSQNERIRVEEIRRHDHIRRLEDYRDRLEAEMLEISEAATEEKSNAEMSFQQHRYKALQDALIQVNRELVEMID